MAAPLNLTDFLEHRSERFLAFFGVVLFAAIIFADRATTWEITSSILYLLFVGNTSEPPGPPRQLRSLRSILIISN